ncbi:TetR/AcrR family transcriptional regulator [Streptomyces aureoverticillatus]|uniref:TetR/AcrR family transcriptional regulator n=1 Tax=Streptomyces aureoverticillatus TaxID=66871 RepID=UPI0013DA69FF|nr:TetR/AcrR family transcriptional regulator [Streptomyces aureoverticillatus]QIB47638.1 TetR/AcrR family transcriptional regulator [Streptomyces aureoverticillatus]
MAANPQERTRRRLSTQERREQLLTVGARLFAQNPYDDVWIEQVAEIAGVSRGLLYHYFPTKRDFFAAVVRRESERMLRLTSAEPGLPVREQLGVGLDAFLAYVEGHAQGFRAFHTAAAAGDPVVREVYREGLAAQERQILAALAADPETAPLTAELPAVRLAVRGWLAFMVAVCLEWLAERELTRAQVRDLCARALLGAILPQDS